MILWISVTDEKGASVCEIVSVTELFSYITENCLRNQNIGM